jgi:chromate transporter
MNKTPPQLTENDVQPVSLRESFWFWLKLGFISFGGPAGQISIMHQELVERRRWISEAIPACSQLLHVVARPRSPTTSHLHWLVNASHLGRIVAGHCLYCHLYSS